MNFELFFHDMQSLAKTMIPVLTEIFVKINPIVGLEQCEWND